MLQSGLSGFPRLAAAPGAVAAALLLAGCLPESREPVTPPTEAVEDAQLAGAWVADFNGSKLYIHVLRIEDLSMDVITVSQEPDGGGDWDEYRGYVSVVGGRHFVNLQSVIEGGSGDLDDSPPFLIVGYGFEGADKLVVRLLSEDRIAAAIEQKRLLGEVSDAGEGRSIAITEGSAKLAQFLSAADPAELFDQSLVFQRLGPAPTP